MTNFKDGAYAMAALSASVVAFRVLVKKGPITREEAVLALLDEAVQRADERATVQRAAKPQAQGDVVRRAGAAQRRGRSGGR